MSLDRARTLHLFLATTLLAGCALAAAAAAADSPRIDDYLLDPATEVALARSAGPPEVGERATVLTLGRSGYEQAVRGDNGFTCMVMRAWDGPSAESSPERFYDPSIRAPICFNPAASETVLHVHLRRSALVAAGTPLEEIKETLTREITAGDLRFTDGRLAVAYMFSAHQHLGRVGAWKPHVMIYAPDMDPADAGGPFLGDHPFVAPAGSNEVPILTIPVAGFVEPVLQ